MANHFLSILKNVGRVAAGVEQVAGPLIGAVGGPGAQALVNLLDPVFQRLMSAPLAVEIQTAHVTQKPPGFDQVRQAAVTTDFDSSLDLTRDILQMNGYELSYSMDLLRASNDAQVASYKAMAALKASFKVLPTTPPATRVTIIDPPATATT